MHINDTRYWYSALNKNMSDSACAYPKLFQVNLVNIMPTNALGVGSI